MKYYGGSGLASDGMPRQSRCAVSVRTSGGKTRSVDGADEVALERGGDCRPGVDENGDEVVDQAG